MTVKFTHPVIYYTPEIANPIEREDTGFWEHRWGTHIDRMLWKHKGHLPGHNILRYCLNLTIIYIYTLIHTYIIYICYVCMCIYMCVYMYVYNFYTFMWKQVYKLKDGSWRGPAHHHSQWTSVLPSLNQAQSKISLKLILLLLYDHFGLIVPWKQWAKKVVTILEGWLTLMIKRR